MRGRRGAEAQELLRRALNHPLRRRILRALHDGGEARSPVQLSTELRAPLSNLNYHVGVLRDAGAIVLSAKRPVRGSTEHFYASTVTGNAAVAEFLESTTEGDRVS